MSERVPGGPNTYHGMYDRVQAALTAIGNIEKAIGDLGTDDLLRAARPEVNTAVAALQSVRDQLSELIAGRGGTASP
jgi:hypothetical protein